MHEEVIISDASPIIALADIQELDLLKNLYKRVLITDVIRNEIHAELPDWIEVSQKYDIRQLQVLQLELDPGEASGIALALQFPNCRIIIDESKGRSVAKRLGIKVTGTLGVIVKAKKSGYCTSGMDILDKLENHGFWLSVGLKEQIKVLLGE